MVNDVDGLVEELNNVAIIADLEEEIIATSSELLYKQDSTVWQ